MLRRSPRWRRMLLMQAWSKTRALSSTKSKMAHLCSSRPKRKADQKRRISTLNCYSLLKSKRKTSRLVRVLNRLLKTKSTWRSRRICTTWTTLSKIILDTRVRTYSSRSHQTYNVKITMEQKKVGLRKSSSLSFWYKSMPTKMSRYLTALRKRWCMTSSASSETGLKSYQTLLPKDKLRWLSKQGTMTPLMTSMGSIKN